MTETETPTLPPSLQPAEIAAGIAKDAQENLAGLDVVSAGPIFADEMGGGLYLRLYTVLPNRASDDFVVHLITLAHVQDTPLAQINRTTLIMALETHFGRCRFSATSWRPPNTARSTLQPGKHVFDGRDSPGLIALGQRKSRKRNRPRLLKSVAPASGEYNNARRPQ